MKLFNIIMTGIDIYLFIYFINFAIDSTDITVRIISCLLATFEVFFLKRDLYNIFSKKKHN